MKINGKNCPQFVRMIQKKPQIRGFFEEFHHSYSIVKKQKSHFVQKMALRSGSRCPDYRFITNGMILMNVSEYTQELFQIRMTGKHGFGGLA